jgi:diguanylate cyclase (GGDEF)-like protein/PAS domain S-box-containing protein
MYGVLLLLIALGGVRAWLSQHWQERRQLDIEILQSVGEQRAIALRIGVLTAELKQQPESSEALFSELAREVLHARSASAHFDALMGSQAEFQPLTAPNVLGALEEWRRSRDGLWSSLLELQAAYPNGDRTWYAGPLRRTQDAISHAESAAHAMLQELGTDVAQRSRRLVFTIWGVVVAIVLLALVLAFTVVEPTARAVRRQYETLSRQADRLKRLAMVAELSSNAIAITDGLHRVVWVNDAFSQLTKYSPRQANGRRIGKLLKARSADPADFAAISEALAKGQGIKREVRVVSKSAELRWVLLDMQPIRETDGQQAGWAMVATDLTQARAQQEILSLAVSGAGLGIWHWDLVANTIDCNERLLTTLGYLPGELDMQAPAWFQLIHPVDQVHWRESMRQHLQDPNVPHCLSVRTRHRAGRWVWMLFTATVADRDPQGRPLRMAGVAMDVNAQKAMEQQLRVAARTDGLTQLPNRAVVVEKVHNAIARHRAQPGYNFAVLYMDFDRFKQVNDTLGHTVGDALLRQIGRRLQDSLRPGDSLVHTSDFAPMAARIGGDEFVVLLDDIRGDLDAEIVAGRLLDVLAVPYQVEGHRVISTASIGIVTSTQAEWDADSVLRDADIAMYEAKRGGRARYAMFDPGMRERVNAAVSLENDLRQALALGQMFVVYQPVVQLGNHALLGVEALVRWRHPQRGLVSPVEFIPVAEACGLIDAVGDFVLRQACRDFEQLQQQLGGLAPPSVAVNLSRAQLRQPRLVSDILDAVRSHNMSPEQLVLEVTESLAAQDSDVQQTLREIQALGVGLSLDDFGTGYSSLSCLHELPVHTVKIDRSFVSQAGHSEYHRVLIDATLRVARALGLGTVAEGIETPEQAQQMLTMGCERGQGFWFSRPLEAQALLAWVHAGGAAAALGAAVDALHR